MNSAIYVPLNLCYSQHFSPKRHRLRPSLPTIFSVLGTSRPGKALQTFVLEFSAEILVFFSWFGVIDAILLCSEIGKVSEIAGDDVLQTFIKERELSGDFIAKVSDGIWLREAINSHNDAVKPEVPDNNIQSPEEASGEESESGGFFKLKRTNEWILGDSALAPANKKMSIKDLQNDSERRRKLNLLKYEAV